MVNLFELSDDAQTCQRQIDTCDVIIIAGPVK